MIKLGYLHYETDINILKQKDNHLKNDLENTLENIDLNYSTYYYIHIIYIHYRLNYSIPLM